MKRHIATMSAVSALALAAGALGAPAAHAQSVDAYTTNPHAADPQSDQQTTDANSSAAVTEVQGGEIVVTAQRRQESITSVPISITVANQQQLERQHVNQISDLGRIAPSLEIQQAPGQNTGGGGSLRGIGTLTFGAGATPSVGVVVDGVSQGNTNISNLFDIDRVEVLKGPQGTLFGLTTSAGVINITTNDPDPSRFSARLRTELSAADFAGSKFGNQVIQGVVNVPLSTNAAVRVSGVANLRQGPNRNALNGHYSDINDYSVRGRAQWRPTDDLKIDLIGDFTQTNVENQGDFFTLVRGQPAGELVIGGFPDPIGTDARLASCGVTVGIGNRDFCTTSTNATHNKNYGGSFQIAYQAAPFTLTSITAYRHNRNYGANFAGNVFRADPLQIEVRNGDNNRKDHLFTQEFRIDSSSAQFFEYTAGVFYSASRATREPESLSVTLTPFKGLPIPPLVIPAVRNAGYASQVEDTSLAVFGQGTFHITDQFRVIAGGRYTGERLSLDLQRADLPNGAHRQLNTEIATYRFGAQYDLASHTMVYGTASRGYKGGQIALPNAPAFPYVVRPETNHAYEAGLKTRILNGLIVDLNGFYENFDSFQSQSCTTVSGSIQCLQSNVDGVKTRGGEINVFGQVTDHLSVNTGFIYAKATYPDGFTGTDGSDLGGAQLPYSPRYKFTFSGNYDQPISNSLKATVAFDTQWKSRVRYEDTSYRDTTFHDHWLVGGQLGLATMDDRFQIALFVRNAFNVHEPLLYQSAFPYSTAQPGPGGLTSNQVAQQNVGAIYGTQSFRQVGLSLEGKF